MHVDKSGFIPKGGLEHKSVIEIAKADEMEKESLCVETKEMGSGGGVGDGSAGDRDKTEIKTKIFEFLRVRTDMSVIGRVIGMSLMVLCVIMLVNGESVALALVVGAVGLVLRVGGDRAESKSDKKEIKESEQ